MWIMPWDDWRPLAFLERNRRRAKKLARDGEPARGRIVGIRGRLGSSEGASTYWEYAVEVRAGAGPFRAGVRQVLEPDDTVRLGMEVDVRHDTRQRTYIDWERTIGAEARHMEHVGWKRVDPPADGIDDWTIGKKELERGRRTTAVAERVGWYDGFWSFVPINAFDLVLSVAEAAGPRQVRVSRQYVPPYAWHLLRDGVVLPVAVHPKKPDRVTIDWAAAAEAEPGVGAPGIARPQEPATTVDLGMPPSAETAAPIVLAAEIEELAGGITFDRWVEVSAGLRREKVKPREWDAYAVEHGVAPGTWDEAVKAWEGRMMQDWTIGARYGQAFEKARKRR